MENIGQLRGVLSQGAEEMSDGARALKAAADDLSREAGQQKQVESSSGPLHTMAGELRADSDKLHYFVAHTADSDVAATLNSVDPTGRNPGLPGLERVMHRLLAVADKLGPAADLADEFNAGMSRLAELSTELGGVAVSAGQELDEAAAQAIQVAEGVQQYAQSI